MAKRKSFADDGWALWVTGDDTSTLYLNQWVNPKGRSYVDVAVRIRGILDTHHLNLYIPYAVTMEEIEDLSYHLRDENVFRAIFSARCILDFMKNSMTSELAYHGKTVDLIHLVPEICSVKPLASGTLFTLSIDDLRPCLDNNEAYLLIRLPHKTLDVLFQPHMNMQNVFIRLRDLVTSPVLSEKYACSIRVNEARLLPDEINQIGSFHRQKLNKTVVTLSVHEDYQVNDANCYRIHRMEKELYGNYAPADFELEDAITYEWIETREKNTHGHYNFYFGISRDSISNGSMFLYMIILLLVGVMGEALATLLGL